MIDLTNTTFMIPVKIETEDRARNLKIIVDYITHHFETNIIINEQDSNTVNDILKGYQYTYMRQERCDGLIHRTKQLNDMSKIAKTKVIVNYDADVLFKPDVYKTAEQLILNNEQDVVFPYLGPFYNVPVEFHDEILTTNSLTHIDPLQKNGHILHPTSVGGALFYNREVYVKAGMENENFVSWGYEDNERMHRFGTLGYRIHRVGDNLYHLHHARTHNSHVHNLYHKNQNEYGRICRMNRTQLTQEITTWGWTK